MKNVWNGIAFAVLSGVVVGAGIYTGSWIAQAIFKDDHV